MCEVVVKKKKTVIRGEKGGKVINRLPRRYISPLGKNNYVRKGTVCLNKRGRPTRCRETV